ncbi:MAG: DUF4399 domain-containing protein [Bacteroidota bacterium]
MKSSIFILLGATALYACSNNASHQEASHTDTSHAGHDHSAMEAPKDTTAILPTQHVLFGNLKDSQTIKLPFIVKFGVEGMEVKPAMGVEANVGHHHLMVDQGHIPAGTMVPMQKETEGYFHFGKGQLQDTLQLKKYPMLTPGYHTLTLQFANGLHLSYGPAMSKTITVKVK